MVHIGANILLGGVHEGRWILRYQEDVARVTKGVPRVPPMMEVVIHPAAELTVVEGLENSGGCVRAGCNCASTMRGLRGEWAGIFGLGMTKACINGRCKKRENTRSW